MNNTAGVKRTLFILLIVSLAFSLLSGALLLVNLAQSGAEIALDNPLVEAERARVEAGEDPALFRELHLMVRRAIFLRIEYLRWGRFTLIISTGLFLFAWQTLMTLYGAPANAHSDPSFIRVPGGGSVNSGASDQSAFGRRTAYSLLSLTLLIAVSGLVSSFIAERYISGRAALTLPFTAGGKGDEKVCPCKKIAALGEFYTAVPQDAQQQWNGLRGSSGSGEAGTGTPPLSWNIDTGENVLWKRNLDTAGRGSPVIWNDHIYLTSADAQNRGYVSCFDAASGRDIWRYALADAGFAQLAPADEQTGGAAPTPATDSNGVYAVFSGGVCAALSHDGRLLWTYDPGELTLEFGYASSPRVYQGKLFLQYDHNGASRLVVLDCATGGEVYKTERPSGPSWSSPVLIDTQQAVMLLTQGSSNVTLSAPLTGEIIWESALLKGEVTPLPAYDGGRVYAVSPADSVIAIDLNKGEKLWDYVNVAPDVASPIAANGRLFIPTSYGMLHCVDGETGTMIWEYDQSEGWYASPLIIGDYLVLFDRAGASQIIAAGGDSAQPIINKIGEAVEATPAWSGKALIVRTATRLIAIGEK